MLRRPMSASAPDALVDTGSVPGEPSRDPLRWLSLAALGVVYGDIGTSPLYNRVVELGSQIEI